MRVKSNLFVDGGIPMSERGDKTRRRTVFDVFGIWLRESNAGMKRHKRRCERDDLAPDTDCRVGPVLITTAGFASIKINRHAHPNRHLRWRVCICVLCVGRGCREPERDHDADYESLE